MNFMAPGVTNERQWLDVNRMQNDADIIAEAGGNKDPNTKILIVESD